MELDKENINKMSDEQLRAKLKELGIPYGPIMPSTRSLYERKLLNFVTTGNTTLNATTMSNVSVLADSTISKTNSRTNVAAATAATTESPKTRRQTTMQKEVDVGGDNKVKTVVETVLTTTTTTFTAPAASNNNKKLTEVVEQSPVTSKTTTTRKEINYIEQPPEQQTTTNRPAAAAVVKSNTHNEDRVYSSNLMNISGLPSLGDESIVKSAGSSSRSVYNTKPVVMLEPIRPNSVYNSQESQYAPTRKVVEQEPVGAATMSPSKVKINSTSSNSYRLIDPTNSGIVFSATSTLARPVKHSEAALLQQEEPVPQPPQRYKIGGSSLERSNHVQQSMTPDKFASRLNEYGMLKTSLNSDLVSKSTNSIRSRPPMHRESLFATTASTKSTVDASSSSNVLSSKQPTTIPRSESNTVSSSTTDKKSDEQTVSSHHIGNSTNKSGGFFSSKLGYSILVMILTALVYFFIMMLQTNPTDPLIE